MGHSMTKHSGGGDTDAPDEVSGLSKKDIAQIQRSWAPMWDQAELVGCNIVRRMLNQENAGKTVLKPFRQMDEEALQNCSQFKGHAINFMSTINNAVNHLHEANVVISMLQTIGGLQTKDRFKFFDVLDKEFLNYMVEDRKLSDSTIESWKRFIAFVNPHIMKQG